MRKRNLGKKGKDSREKRKDFKGKQKDLLEKKSLERGMIDYKFFSRVLQYLKNNQKIPLQSTFLHQLP